MKTHVTFSSLKTKQKLFSPFVCFFSKELFIMCQEVTEMVIKMEDYISLQMQKISLRVDSNHKNTKYQSAM